MMKNPFKVLIITCWILLVLCCIAKLFGANWFEPNVNNEKIKVMFGFLDEHIVWKYIVYCIYAVIAHSLVINAILGQNITMNNLVNELRSCPIPAQPVYGSQPIFTCPNNNGCGCGGQSIQ